MPLLLWDQASHVCPPAYPVLTPGGGVSAWIVTAGASGSSWPSVSAGASLGAWPDMNLPNYAATFNATLEQWLSANDHSTLDFTTAMTIHMWFRADLAASSLVLPLTEINGVQNLISKANYSTSWSWAAGLFRPDSSGIRLEVAIPTTGTDFYYTNYGLTPAFVTSDRWYYIAIVYDGGGASNADRLKVYIDSVLQTLSFVGTMPGTLVNSSSDMVLGWLGGNVGSRHWHGCIDRVGLHNTVLSGATVSSLWNNGQGKSYSDLTAGEKTGLVSFYDMDEHSLTRADSHGSNTLIDHNGVGRCDTWLNVSQGSSSTAWPAVTEDECN